MKKHLKHTLIVTGLGLLAVTGYLYWQYEQAYPSTDDAYVNANVINVAARVDGMVTQVFVKEHQHVVAGQPLFNLDATPFQVALNRAQANLDNAKQQVAGAQSEVITSQALVAERQAQYENTQKDTKRTLTLVAQKLYAVSQGDNAISNLAVSKAALHAALSQLNEAKQKLGALGENNASIRAAKAALAQAELNLSYTHVVAAADGYLVNVTLRQGDQVNAYQDLFALVENNQWWVTANFKETDLARIRPNQNATVTIDMYPNHPFQGKVSSISEGSGASFSLLPPENATGNWIKVTQRFPIRIRIQNDARFPLRMGASSKVVIDTQTQA